MPENKELFNNAAPVYDQTFTNSHIGKRQRERVYHWLDQIQFFKQTKRVFEINCGTGYDAEYFSKKGLKVTATDASSGMISVARKQRPASIDFFQMRFDQIDEASDISEAVFSNFGGLNCISNHELIDFSKKLAKKQKRGELLIWVIMPRRCFMEFLFFLFTLKWGSLFRRNTDNPVAVNVDGETVNTYYHSPRAVKRILASDYTVQLVKPVAFFLPPSYLEPFFAKRLRLLNFLNRLEGFFGKFSMLASASDHYIIIAERK